MTILTFAVDVCLTVAEFVFLQLEKGGEPVPYLQKGTVFLLSTVDVAREKAEHIQRHEDQLKDPEDDALEKDINQQQDEVDPEQSAVELVIAVSAIHEANDAIDKTGFLHDTSFLVR